MKRLFSPVRSFVLGVFLACAAVAQAHFEGRVIGIVDGDTIDVLADRTLTPVRVRLAEIDAPEKRQAYGQRAKQALAELVFERDVWVMEQGQDRYGRILGHVYTGTRSTSALLNGRGPTSVNRGMVEAGMAWAYRPFLKDDALVSAEAQARARKRGLWADSQTPVPPWQWRADVRRTMN